MSGGKRPEPPDISEAIRAIRLLHVCGQRSGIVFPIGDGEIDTGAEKKRCPNGPMTRKTQGHFENGKGEIER